MRNRRFVLLSAILVALNIGLWIVPQGLALQQTFASALFGKSMVRAEVLEVSGADWRLDRGIVVSNVAGVLTLQEADTKIQAISVSSSTKATTPAGVPFKVKNIKPGWRVLVQWPAPAGTAVSVLIEKRTST